MQVIKEKAANIAASANSGLEKTKAVFAEKVDLMIAQDVKECDMATQRKEERINAAERHKQEVYESNAALYSSTGEPGQQTGSHQMSALPGHGTGEPTGPVTEGVTQFHPIGTATNGTQSSSTANNTQVERTSGA